MFNLFKRPSKKEKLLRQYKKIREKAYHLSKTDRINSDLLYAKSEKLLEEIEELPASE